MAEYIDKEAVLEIVAEWCPDDDGSVGKIGDLREMLDEIESIPDADVRENVRGHWVIDETFGSFACSICGSWHSGGFDSWRSPFCPNCGALMGGAEDG